MGSEENSTFNRPRKMRFQKIWLKNGDRKIVFQKKSYFHQNREMDNQKIVYFESRLKNGVSRKLYQVPAIFLQSSYTSNFMSDIFVKQDDDACDGTGMI